MQVCVRKSVFSVTGACARMCVYTCVCACYSVCVRDVCVCWTHAMCVCVVCVVLCSLSRLCVCRCFCAQVCVSVCVCLFVCLCVRACVCMVSAGRTLCPSWQEEPKSTILMALRFGLQSRMFSGFRSQWMMLSSGVARNSSAAAERETVKTTHKPPSQVSVIEPFAKCKIIPFYSAFQLCYHVWPKFSCVAVTQLDFPFINETTRLHSSFMWH